jgi:hypothetical protein
MAPLARCARPPPPLDPQSRHQQRHRSPDRRPSIVAPNPRITIHFCNRPFGVKPSQTIPTITASMSVAGWCFSSESAPPLFHHGFRRRDRTIQETALPSDVTGGPSGLANSSHPLSGEGHLSPVGATRAFSYRFDPGQPLRSCDFSGPTERGAVNIAAGISRSISSPQGDFLPPRSISPD